MDPNKKVFTIGEVAKHCKVASKTASKWFNSGQLKGYRIPGSQDRRVSREYLIAFLKTHGMPLGDLEFKPMTSMEKLRYESRELLRKWRTEEPVRVMVEELLNEIATLRGND